MYPEVLFFDDDLKQPHNKEDWKRVGLVSLQFSLFSAWKGLDTIPAKDEDRLRRIVNSVHAAGKSIRFWDAPDNVNGWKALMKLGVDFIGTDRIEALSRFVKE
jgi:alkaline phosphatase